MSVTTKKVVRGVKCEDFRNLIAGMCRLDCTKAQKAQW